LSKEEIQIIKKLSDGDAEELAIIVVKKLIKSDKATQNGKSSTDRES
jgi:hypothetical protein